MRERKKNDKEDGDDKDGDLNEQSGGDLKVENGEEVVARRGQKKKSKKESGKDKDDKYDDLNEEKGGDLEEEDPTRARQVRNRRVEVQTFKRDAIVSSPSLIVFGNSLGWLCF